jgi:hypothetical protein
VPDAVRSVDRLAERCAHEKIHLAGRFLQRLGPGDPESRREHVSKRAERMLKPALLYLRRVRLDRGTNLVGSRSVANERRHDSTIVGRNPAVASGESSKPSPPSASRRSQLLCNCRARLSGSVSAATSAYCDTMALTMMRRCRVPRTPRDHPRNDDEHRLGLALAALRP